MTDSTSGNSQPVIRAQHTPGPWETIVDEQVPERGRIYIVARGRYEPQELIGEASKTDADVEDGDLTNTEANARLIAASPTLYVYVAEKAAQGDADAARIISSI